MTGINILFKEGGGPDIYFSITI